MTKLERSFLKRITPDMTDKERHNILKEISELMKEGTSIDLDAILDKLLETGYKLDEE